MESNFFGWVDLLYYRFAHLSSLSLVWGHYPQLRVSPGIRIAHLFVLDLRTLLVDLELQLIFFESFLPFPSFIELALGQLICAHQLRPNM